MNPPVLVADEHVCVYYIIFMTLFWGAVVTMYYIYESGFVYEKSKMGPMRYDVDRVFKSSYS